MTLDTPDELEVAARVREWRRSALASTCDVIEPWEAGVVARCARHPHYYEFNVVQVRQEPAMDLPDLIDFADRALAGLEHRRIDFERAENADQMRPEFERRGWKSMRLLHMRYAAERPSDAITVVEEVPYDAVADLRVAWHEEDFPGVDAAEYFGSSREVALARGARTLAVREGRAWIAFAQIECAADAAEITSVYVHPAHRGHGLGTALTSAAIAAAPAVRDLWITADDEDRPKQLYARLGFRPVSRELQFLRIPS
jgi:GNAT superfamily N-acetyltransferase